MTAFAFVYKGKVFNEFLRYDLEIRRFETFLNPDDSLRYMAIFLKNRHRSSELEKRIKIYNENMLSDAHRIFLAKFPSEDKLLIPLYQNKRNGMRENPIYEAMQAAKQSNNPTYESWDAADVCEDLDIPAFLSDEEEADDSQFLAPVVPVLAAPPVAPVLAAPPVVPVLAAPPVALVLAAPPVAPVLAAPLVAPAPPVPPVLAAPVQIHEDDPLRIRLQELNTKLEKLEQRVADASRLTKIQEEVFMAILKDKDELILSLHGAAKRARNGN